MALLEKNILIKNCSKKEGVKGQYIRIAVNSREDNDFLISKLKDCFQNLYAV